MKYLSVKNRADITMDAFLDVSESEFAERTAD